MLLSIKSISYFIFFPVLHKMFWVLEYQSANGTLEHCGAHLNMLLICLILLYE